MDGPLTRLRYRLRYGVHLHVTSDFGTASAWTGRRVRVVGVQVFGWSWIWAARPWHVAQSECSVCGGDTLCYPDPPGVAFCPAHCPDHVYEYDRGMGRHCCETCGDDPPHDWFGDDPWD